MILIILFIAYATTNDEIAAGRKVTTKTGPNDVRRVIWALSEFFFTFFFVILILTNVFIEYIKSKDGILDREGRVDEKGTTKINPRYLFFKKFSL